MSTQPGPGRHHVLIIGSGFGGLFAAKALRRKEVDITIIDRTTHHLFQPLLYQVATGILAEGEIAPKTRIVLKSQRNVAVRLGDVTTIDLAGRTVTAEHAGITTVTGYDSLIVAAGAHQSYFGNDHFAEHAPGMKTIDDALELRGRILGALEEAEVCADPQRRARLLTFVVIGAGPTGVEMAGQIAELAHRTLRGAYRNIDPRDATIILLDGAQAVLPPFGERLGEHAARALTGLGVRIELGCLVTDVDANGLRVRDADGHEHRIEAACKIWSAGVSASTLGAQLAVQTGAQLDRAGRVMVNPDLTLPGHPNVFVVGDMMALNALPGVAQVAIQGGRHAARLISDAAAPARRRPERTFSYRDKGSMATIARWDAVAKIGSMQLTGPLAWLMWLAVHVVYVVGYRSRISTLIAWAWTFAGNGRGQLTTTSQQAHGRNAIAELRHLRRRGVEVAPGLDARAS
ncbi:NADH dehydrogenase [Mycobacterium sp. BK558]|nr:NADH dehydrogenase [Mycobacterium sp. BK558]